MKFYNSTKLQFYNNWNLLKAFLIFNQKSLKRTFKTVISSTKQPSKFVFSCCEFTKAVLY